MALFTLSDIKFKTEPKQISDVNKYQSLNFRFPEDLGNADKGHYMVIFINVQEKTNFNFTEDVVNSSTIVANRKELEKSVGEPVNLGGIAESAINAAAEGVKYGGPALNSIINNLEKNSNRAVSEVGKGLNKFIDTISPFGSAIKSIAGQTGATAGYLTSAKFLRTTKRTTDTIALYMPDTVNFQQNQNFSDLSLGGELLSRAGAAGYSALTSGKNTIKNITPFVADFIKQSLSGLGTSSGQAIFTSIFGAVQNPQLELIYTSPNFRSFNFEFNFYPRSEKEAKNVQNIIQRLKFHQAPELLKGTAGYFLVPPSEFDIKFYYNGTENPNIPKISTCVLTSINVDYAPNGFQTFETGNDASPKMGQTGMPVGIRMTLGFKETQIITKYDYPEAGYEIKNG